MSSNLNPAPEPPDQQPVASEAVSDDAFKQWLAADPENQQHFAEIAEDILGGEYGKLPPELHLAARRVVTKFNEQRSMRLVTEKTKTLMAILQQPLGSMPSDERKKQCQTLAEEITNTILELPEPHRSALLKIYVPMWEKLLR